MPNGSGTGTGIGGTAKSRGVPGDRTDPRGGTAPRAGIVSRRSSGSRHGIAPLGLFGARSHLGARSRTAARPLSPRRRHPAPAVDQCVQGRVEVEVRGLEPVGELLVGEAVAVARGDEEALGEDGRGPALPPREQLLEGGPVEDAVARAETAAGCLVDLPGDPGGEQPHGGPPY